MISRKVVLELRAEAVMKARTLSLSAILVQKIWRGWVMRKRIDKLLNMKFTYQDDELDELEQDEAELLDFDLKENGGEGGEDDGWRPTKPIIKDDDDDRVAAVVVKDEAWNAPVQKEEEEEEEEEVEGRGQSPRTGVYEEREISSPFDARKKAPPPVSRLNLKDFGFKADPTAINPSSMEYAQNERDMEVQSIASSSLLSQAELTARKNTKNEGKKTELMNDWGFTNSKTAEIMMKRKKRMTQGARNAAKKKKAENPDYRLRKLQRERYRNANP